MNLNLKSALIALLEGCGIAIAAYLITNKKISYKELAILVLTITATLFILDVFAPSIAGGARQGAGFGLGYQQFAGNPKKYYDEKYVKVSHEYKDSGMSSYTKEHTKF
jgi:hypothetical protein